MNYTNVDIWHIVTIILFSIKWGSLQPFVCIDYNILFHSFNCSDIWPLTSSFQCFEILRGNATFAIITFCWLVSFVVQLIPLTYYHSEHVFLIRKVFLVFILLAFLVCPLVFIIYTYSNIFRELTVILRKQRSSTYTGAIDKARTYETISTVIHENTSK